MSGTKHDIAESQERIEDLDHITWDFTDKKTVRYRWIGNIHNLEIIYTTNRIKKISSDKKFFENRKINQ